MSYEELERRIRKAREDGFKDGEIVRALQSEGYSRQDINRIFRDLNSMNRQQSRKRREAGQKRSEKEGRRKGRNQRKSMEADDQQRSSRVQQGRKDRQNRRDVVPGVDLSGNEFELRQKWFSIGTTYRVYRDEEEILKGHKKGFKIKEKFNFENPEGEQVMTAEARQMLDIMGEYELRQGESGEVIAVLEKEFSIGMHRWKIKTDDDRLLARVESRNQLVALLRVAGGLLPYIPNVFKFIPHTYSILGPEDEELGEIEEELSIRDKYMIRVGETGGAPKEAVVASAMAIDALEGN